MAEILSFGEARCADVRVAGGKGASLAAMTAGGFAVPPGFVVPADALAERVDAEELRHRARAQDWRSAQALARSAEPPLKEIAGAYARLGGGEVAVRSSACAEDSDTASFAGQQETYLNVCGAQEVAARVVDCWASFFSQRALFYRARKGSMDDLAMAVVVQRMVEAEKSGVIFTIDPVQRRRDRMVVEAVAGLGEQVVSGAVTPDHYVLNREGLVQREQLGNGGVLGPEELRRLAELGRALDERFGPPQDIEWAIADGQIYLLQSRPVTTL
jgi:pyruvate,water dikinase